MGNFSSNEERCYYQDILYFRSYYTLYRPDPSSNLMSFGYVIYDHLDKFITYFEKMEDVVVFCEREIKFRVLNGDLLGKN